VREHVLTDSLWAGTRPSARVIYRALAAVAASGILAACGASGGGSGGAAGNGAAATSSVVSTRQLAGVGDVLVDGSGKTIYSPDQEKAGRILCTSSCTSFWLPVTGSQNAISSEAGTLSGALGTIHRPDGKTQLTYNRRPLYTFVLESGPGQTRGNDFKDSFNGTSFTWRAVTTGQAAANQGSGAVSPSQQPQPSYGDGSGY
jgi:predicted lipoprotein with Yx(FWY)xxD motif